MTQQDGDRLIIQVGVDAMQDGSLQPNWDDLFSKIDSLSTQDLQSVQEEIQSHFQSLSASLNRSTSAATRCSIKEEMGQLHTLLLVVESAIHKSSTLPPP